MKKLWWYGLISQRREIQTIVIRVEEDEGHYYDHIYVDEIGKVSAFDIRPPPSNWVLQKILDFGKMVGVSYDGYENRLLELFEELEVSRGWVLQEVR